MFRPALTAAALGALAVFSGNSRDARAATTIVDRGLPTDNLNDPAGGDRSNVTWSVNGFKFTVGDTFSLPPTGKPALQSWRLDRVRTWFTAESPAGSDTFELDTRFDEISLFLGPGTGAGSVIDRVGNAPITGNSADAANVTITPVTYDGGEDYQGFNGTAVQIWQVDFTDLGVFSPGDYTFSVSGLPTDQANSGMFHSHASNAALDGTPSQGADDELATFIGSAGSTSVTLNGFVNTQQAGLWDKPSDINVQVSASPVPLPAAGGLLLGAVGGLAGAGALRRRRAAA